MLPLGCEYPNSISIKYHAHILVSYFRIYFYLPASLGCSVAFGNPLGLGMILPIKLAEDSDMERILPIELVTEDMTSTLSVAWLPIPELNLLLCMIFLWLVTSPPSQKSDDNVTIW